jgi:disulfide bond formation protein DsbB
MARLSPMDSTSLSVSTRKESTVWLLIFSAWLVAGVSVLGALFLGEVMKLPTCVLCWYQRVFMFPLALILPVGLFPLDRKVIRYALPLAVIGWLLTVFHLLLVEGVIPESIQPCTRGVPCSETVIDWFGFVTIPLLSLLAFSTIVALLVAAHFRGAK